MEHLRPVSFKIFFRLWLIVKIILRFLDYFQGRGGGIDSPSGVSRRGGRGGGRGRKKAMPSYDPIPGDPDKPFACERKSFFQCLLHIIRFV